MFKELKHNGIRLIGASDGFDSDRRGAKMEPGMRGIMNETYLDDLADKTHRGLEGQFLRGFHVGGHLFGYRSEPVFEADGRTDAHGERSIAGYRIRIEEGEVEVVRRIYDLYAHEHLSVNEIVRRLNAESVAWPGANTGFAAVRKGWAHSLVVNLLDSEKYAGHWVWNRRRWFKDSRSGKRRYVERPESEWTRKEIAELALIGPDTWCAARARRAEQRAKYPHFASVVQPGGVLRGPVRHLLSGLLICGTCGGAVTIVGGQKKQTADGMVDYRTYGCTNRFRKGREFCTNGKTTSLRKLESAVIGGLQHALLHPQARERFIQRFRTRVADELRRREPELKLAKVSREQASLKAELDRLIALYAAGTGEPGSVQRAVAQREARLAELHSQAEALRGLSKSADLLPHASVIKAYLDDLSGTLLESDRQRARTMLERHVGKITLTAKNDGPRPYYVASGRFDFGRLDESHKRQGVAGAGFEPATFGL